MSTHLPDTTVPEAHREKYDADARVCEICGTDVPHGVIGMSEHIGTEHIQEEIVKALSRPWRPPEPLMLHHPDGASHIVTSYGEDWAETQCGRSLKRAEVAPEVDASTWCSELLSHAHVDADRYCQSCIRLQERKPNPLPGPLQSEQIPEKTTHE